MGQQQLLLIVVGVIVVGIAIIVGVNIFETSAQISNREGIFSDLHTIGNFAIEYYHKRPMMGGGSLNFTGWTIPATHDTTINGTFTATVSALNVTLVGTGTEIGNDGSAKVKATATITPTGITITVNN